MAAGKRERERSGPPIAVTDESFADVRAIRMTSVLVSSIIATLFATAVVFVVVDPSHAHARYSTTSSPSSATFAPDSNGTATTTTTTTTATAQVVKTFDEIYNDT